MNTSPNHSPSDKEVARLTLVLQLSSNSFILNLQWLLQLPVDNVIIVPAPAAKTKARWDVTNDMYLQ